MKGLFCLLLFVVVSAAAYSQNPLADGVNNTPMYEEEDVAVYLKLEKFSLTTGNCGLEYSYDGVFIDGYAASTYQFKHDITVNYKNITKIDVFYDAIEVTAKDIETQVDGEDPFLAESQEEGGLMTIYFSSLDASKAAATWLKEQVSACGGTAEIIEP